MALWLHAIAGRGAGPTVMLYRITGSIYRRAYFPVAAVVVIAAFAWMTWSEPGGPTASEIVYFAVECAWVTAFAVRGWRGGTLLATEDKVTVRQLIWTRSWSWQQIDGFTIETRSQPRLMLPVVKVQRDVLKMQFASGGAVWLSEICWRPPASEASQASVRRLSELALTRRVSGGVAG